MRGPLTVYASVCKAGDAVMVLRHEERVGAGDALDALLELAERRCPILEADGRAIGKWRVHREAAGGVVGGGMADAHGERNLVIRVESRAVERTYDIVLFGATGFVGELTAEYLAAHAPEGARIAIAGRDKERLEALGRRLPRADVGVLVADASDASSVRALAEATRVVITTVGPYLQYGEPLVAACAAAGTDYVDLTGESEFVDLMYLRYHAVARESGARLVHSCGFDSIPYDLGALFTVSQLPDDVPIALQGFGLASGAISGGTFQSAVNQMGRLKEAGRLSRQRRSVERHADDGAVAEGRRV